jgi:hypothetical protein
MTYRPEHHAYRAEMSPVDPAAPVHGCGCDEAPETVSGCEPIGDCELTPGDDSPVGRCPACGFLLYVTTPPPAVLFVEVHAVEDCPSYGMARIDHAPELAHAIGVYVCNPLPMHVEDFEVGGTAKPAAPDDVADAIALAFGFADALAAHLGTTVVSALVRPQSEGNNHG